jgi:hypothetical protein
MNLRMVSGTLLILLIVDFALAAPVLVQEERIAGADMADIHEHPRTMLERRGKIRGEIEEVGGKYIENWFVLKDPPAIHGPSSSVPAPKPGPSTESDHLLAGMGAPPSSTVHPTWLSPDNKLLQPNTGPLTDFDLDDKWVVVEPPSPVKGSPSTKSV